MAENEIIRLEVLKHYLKLQFTAQKTLKKH